MALTSWLRTSRPASGHRRSKRSYSPRLRVERLEDRCTPTAGLCASLVADIVPGAVLGPGTRDRLTREPVTRRLDEAFARRETVGAGFSTLGRIDMRSADLPGGLLGLAGGNTIYLDINATGWGRFVDQTPGGGSEFTAPGNQGEQPRRDLRSVVIHELGHRLGFGHSAGGVMGELLTAGTRRRPGN